MTRRESCIAACVAVVLALAACSSSPPQTPTPTPSVERPVGEAAEIGCPTTVHLVEPDGDPVNLTGLWSPAGADLPFWNGRQIGDCFFLSALGEPEPPGYYQQQCDGLIGSDFVITVRCIDFLQGGLGVPNISQPHFRIQFAEAGTTELVRCLELDVPATCEDPLVPWDGPT